MESSTFASRMKVCGARRERIAGSKGWICWQPGKERKRRWKKRKKEGSKERNTVAEREENIDRRRLQGMPQRVRNHVVSLYLFVFFFLLLFSLPVGNHTSTSCMKARCEAFGCREFFFYQQAKGNLQRFTGSRSCTLELNIFRRALELPR